MAFKKNKIWNKSPFITNIIWIISLILVFLLWIYLIKNINIFSFKVTNEDKQKNQTIINDDGVIIKKSTFSKDQIESISDDRERLNIRLSALDKRYRAQFTAMDILVAQLQSIGNFLTSQLANLPKPNSIK